MKYKTEYIDTPDGVLLDTEACNLINLSAKPPIDVETLDRWSKNGICELEQIELENGRIGYWEHEIVDCMNHYYDKRN